MKTAIDFKLLQERALMLHGVEVSKRCIQMLNAIERGDQEKAAKLLKDYYNEQPQTHRTELVAQMNGIRMETTQTLVYPSMNFGRFFKIVNLLPDESPFYRNDYGTSVTYTYVGQGNKPTIHEAEASVDSIQVNLGRIAVRTSYQLQDLYNGNVAEIHKKHLDTAFDFKDQLEGICYDTLVGTASTYSTWGGAFGSFVTTGKMTRRSYIPRSSRVKVANLPATNDVSIGSPTTNTKFTPETMTAIVNYCAGWGDGFADGPLRPTGEIIIPAKDIQDMGGVITATTTQINTVGEQVLANGYIAGINWLGIPWRFIPDNTLDVGKCFPILNKPVGTLFRKPSMDMTETKRDVIANKEENTDIFTFGIVVPWTQRLNALRVTYKTTS